jgi:hypothetical protein
MSAGIIAAQIVMVPMALLVGAVVCWLALPEAQRHSATDASRLRQSAKPASGIAAE